MVTEQGPLRGLLGTLSAPAYAITVNHRTSPLSITATLDTGSPADPAPSLLPAADARPP